MITPMSDDHLQQTARFAPVDIAAIRNDTQHSEPATERFLAAVPRPQPLISLGPYEQQSSALAAGNLGMTNGHWQDYDTQGVPGRWYIVPSRD